MPTVAGREGEAPTRWAFVLFMVGLGGSGMRGIVYGILLSLAAWAVILITVWAIVSVVTR